MSTLKKQDAISTREFQPTTIVFSGRLTQEQWESAGEAAVAALAERGITARFAGGTRTQIATTVDLLPTEVKQ